MPKRMIRHAVRRGAARRQMMADPIGRMTVEQYQEVKGWYANTSEWSESDHAYVRRMLCADRRQVRRTLKKWL